ncbi:MAG: macro domain-containing protein [Anaerolineae bacterium]|nr:MAG: macro domain-containing protein [Anaerolineae bacterium]
MSEILRAKALPNGTRLELARGDITAEQVDAIVNAANAQLMHGGGVAAAIARKGGAVVWEQSRAWVREHGPVPHDQPAWTEGGNLPCRYVIHAVGPVWRGGGQDEDEHLSAAVSGSLRRADELGLHSIAFPAISTGIFGYPKKRAAAVMLRALAAYFSAHPDSGVRQVRLVLYDTPTVNAFVEVWDSEQA